MATNIPSPTHSSDATASTPDGSGGSSSSSGLSIHVSAASPPKVNPSPRRASVMSARRQTFNNTNADNTNGNNILEAASAELRTKAPLTTSSSKPNSRRQTGTAATLSATMGSAANNTSGAGATLKANSNTTNNLSSTSPWNSRPNSNHQQRKVNQRAPSSDDASALLAGGDHNNPYPFPASIVRAALTNAGPITQPVAQGLWEALRCGQTRWAEFTTTECNYTLNAFSSVLRLTANEPIFTAGDFPSFFAVILAGGVVSSLDNNLSLATPTSPPTSPNSLPEFLSATNVGTTGDIIGSEHFFSSQAHALLHAATNHGEKPEAIKRLSQLDGSVLPSTLQPLFSSQGKEQILSQLQSQIHGMADLSFMSSNGSAPLLALHPVRPTTVVAASSGVTLALFSFEQVRSLLREADPITYGKLLAILAAENAQRTTVAQMEGSMDRWWHCELEAQPVSPAAGPVGPPSLARQSSAVASSAQPGPPSLGRTASVVSSTPAKKASTMNSPPSGPRGIANKLSPNVSAARPAKAESARTVKPACPSVGCCAVPIMEEALWSRISDRMQHQNELLAHIRAPNPRGSFAMGAESMNQVLSGGGYSNLTPGGTSMAPSATHSRRSSFTGTEDAPAPKSSNGRAESPVKSPAKPPTAPSASSTASSTTTTSTASESWKKKATNLAAQVAQLQALLSESITSEKYWKTAHQSLTSNLQDAQTRYDALKKQHDDLLETHKGCEKAVVDFVTLEKVLCSPFMTRMDAEQREAERVERLYALQAQQTQNGYTDPTITPGSLDDGTSSGSRSVNRGSLPSNLSLNVTGNIGSDTSILQLPAEGFDERDVLVSPVMHHDESLDRPYSTFLTTPLTPAQLSVERTKYSSRINYLMKKYTELKTIKKEHSTLKAQLNKMESSLSTTNVAKLDIEDSLSRLTTQLHNTNRTLEFTLKLNMGYKVDIANYQTILKVVLLHIHLKQYMMRRRGVAVLEKLREIRMEMSLKGFAEEDSVDGSRRSGANNELSTLVPSLTGFGVNRGEQNRVNQNKNYQPLPASFMAESIQARSREQVSQLHSPQNKKAGTNNNNSGNVVNNTADPASNSTPAPLSGTGELVALSQATGMNLTIAAPQKQAATTKGKRQNGAAAAAASSESDNAQDSLQRSTLDLVPKLLRAFVELESGVTVGEQIRLMQQLQQAKLEKLNSKAENGEAPAEMTELERLMDRTSLAYEAFTDPLPASSPLVKSGYLSGRSSAVNSPAPSRRTLILGSTESFLSSPQATPETRAKLSPPPNIDPKQHRRLTSQTPLSNQQTVPSLNTPSMMEFLTLLKDETLLTAQNFVQLRSQLLLWRQTAAAFFQRNLESSDRIHELLKEREENQASNAQLRKANATLQTINAQLTAAHAAIEKDFGKSESVWQHKRAELEAVQVVELQKLSDKRSKYRHQIRALEVRLGSMLMQEQAAQATNTTAEGFSHADVRSLEKVMDVLNPYATSSLKRTVLAKHGVQIEKWTRSPSTNGEREHSKKAQGKSRAANGEQMECTLPRIWTSHSQRYEDMSGSMSERKPRKQPQQHHGQASPRSNPYHTPLGMSSTGMLRSDHSLSPHHPPHPPPSQATSTAKRFHLHSKSPGPSSQQQPPTSSLPTMKQLDDTSDQTASAEEKEREQSSNVDGATSTSASGSLRSSTSSLPPPSFDERSPFFTTGQDSLEASSDEEEDESDTEADPNETEDVTANSDAEGADEELPLPSIPAQNAMQQVEINGETNDDDDQGEITAPDVASAPTDDNNQQNESNIPSETGIVTATSD